MPDIIKSISAYVAILEDGSEGICGFLAPDGMWTPLIGADHARLISLKPIAQKIANESGRTLRLVRLSKRTDIATITPETH